MAGGLRRPRGSQRVQAARLWITRHRPYYAEALFSCPITYSPQAIEGFAIDPQWRIYINPHTAANAHNRGGRRVFGPRAEPRPARPPRALPAEPACPTSHHDRVEHRRGLRDQRRPALRRPRPPRRRRLPRRYGPSNPASSPSSTTNNSSKTPKPSKSPSSAAESASRRTHRPQTSQPGQPGLTASPQTTAPQRTPPKQS